MLVYLLGLCVEAVKAEALPVHVHEVGYVLQSEALHEQNIYHWKRKCLMY